MKGWKAQVIVAGIFLPACFSGVAHAEDEDLFRSEVAGIELKKPGGWRFQNLEALAKARASAKLKDEEIQERMNQLATAPLVVATRHPEPYGSLNPSLQVLVRPLGQLQGSSGREILDLVLPTLRNAFQDFELVSPISPVEVDGVKGAQLTAEYTVATNEGLEFETRATIVVIPRKSYMYQFSFSAPPTGPDALTDEVTKTLESVEFLEGDA